MKKSTAVTIIAILAVIIAVLGILFMTNQKKNTDEISKLKEDILVR